MKRIGDESLRQLFTDARSFSAWLPTPVDDDTLRELYDLVKWGPTSANSCPARIVFVKSGAAKERLLSCVTTLNLDKVRTAAVTAIVAQDESFYDFLPKLLPHKDFRTRFVQSKPLAEETAFRNSTLQGAYLILAARALGLDCGPLSGFDKGKVDAAFFEGTSWKSNFLCCLGHGDRSQAVPRLPRLTFEEAARIL